MCIKNRKYIALIFYINSCIFLYADGLQKKIIVLDPGHATKNSQADIVNYGCKSKLGTRELDLVIDISEILNKELIKNNMITYFTRDRNHFWRRAETQSDDNQSRAEFANLKNADVFLRVHCNWSVSSKKRGISVLWFKEDSKKLAEIVLKEIRKTGAIIDGIEKKELVGFRFAKVPTILVEFGYLSNQEDEKLLKNKEYIKKLSDAIVKGLNIYFEEKQTQVK
ncbi:MAG: hypothetical protein A2539_01695 [Elusimicrobia bacterium RIFOXYD2_FULL_34_15]|nr:MAG: hypothetical protein A2539_01695 [Elusimicrobia bacterium RIFOXYD2_FULL_34_15]